MISKLFSATVIAALTCAACSANSGPGLVQASDTRGSATAPSAPGALIPAGISCTGTDPFQIPPAADAPAQPVHLAQLQVDVAAQTGTLTFKDWPHMPTDAQALSCGQVVGADGQFFCATSDHAFAATTDGKTGSLLVGNSLASSASLVCTETGTLPPSSRDDRAKIAVGQYVPAMSSATPSTPTCDFSDRLVLDKTVVGGNYVVTLVHQPGTYCTPADIAKRPDASFAIVSALLEQCYLVVKAVDASGRALEIRDQRQGLPADPNGPSCSSGFGALAVATEIPGIANAWNPMP